MLLPRVRTADNEELILSRVLPRRFFMYSVVFEKIPIFSQAILNVRALLNLSWEFRRYFQRFQV